METLMLTIHIVLTIISLLDYENDPGNVISSEFREFSSLVLIDKVT